MQKCNKSLVLTTLITLFSSICIYSQNLITNGDFGLFNAAVPSPAPLGYTTTYTQIPYNGTAAFGVYSITNNPQPLAPAYLFLAYDISEGIIGNGTGNMMYVDGKNNQIFWKQDPPVLLEAGKKYIFSFWTRNMNQTVTNGPPNPAATIRFNPGCTGCVSSTSTTGLNKNWVQVTYQIIPTITEMVSIELSTVNAGSSANNFAIDDISLTPPILPLSASFSKAEPSCPTSNDGSIVAYGNSGIPPFTYNLTGTKTDSNSTGVFTGLGPGTYEVTVVDSDVVQAPVKSPLINLVAPPDMTLTSSPTGCVTPSSSVTLTASNGGATYNWSASTGVVIPSTASNVNVTPAVNTTYTVTSSRAVPNTNLITNGDFEEATTSGFFSDYVYTATSSSLSQFDYGITTNPNLWNATFISSTDRSGAGKMLVTKGATTANKTIWSQTVVVDNSKTYTFEFYVQNAVAASPAQFRVLINGVQIVISPLAATNGASAGWTRISGTWNSGLSSTAKIQIIDTNIALAGNDFAIDDISFSTVAPPKNCLLTKTVQAKVSLTSNFAPIPAFCSGSVAPILSTTSPNGIVGTWSPSTINNTVSGLYTFTPDSLLDTCAVGQVPLTTTVTPNMTVGSASSSPTLCINTPLTSITHSTTGATGIGAATGLPAGVSASFGSNTITITGTPSASGTFNYSIPLNGGCGTVAATGTITVSPNNTVGVASSSPTLCINTPLTSITHSTTGATGIGAATGLPAGVSASFGSNTITITGTPSASGTFNYSIPLNGGCGTVATTGTITVSPNNTVGVASSSPTLCINTPLTSITHSTTGATGIGAATGLPAGVSASFGSNTITITGTPSASGTFNYSIPLNGGCGTVAATGTITVSPNNTVGVASSSPTLCINTPLTSITHSTTGATGIGAATGLPAGVSASFGSNTITITGTPSASGTFNYSIPLNGGCGTVAATGTITVSPNNTVGVASSSPTLCINTPLTSITHSTTGATGIGAATGLPAGVSASFGSNTITITGTPSASGTFNYSIPLNGGCGTVAATGTITVSPNNTVGVASSSPTLCINTPLTSITHSTTGATGIGAATGLPAGVSASFGSNTITITGTPSASGTFNYSIPLNGGCGTVAATGTITVSPNNTVGVASSSPTLCINTPLTSITHSTTGATGIGAATGLPAGVSASFGSNTITITGTPSASGTFNYSIPLNGGCGIVLNAIGTITINALPLAPTSGGDLTECEATPIQTLTAAATSPIGSTVVWYDAATGGSIVASPTLNSIGTITYYAESVNSTTNCASSTRTPIVLTINAASIQPISGGDITECEATPLQTLTAAATSPVGSTAVWYDATTGGSIVASPILNSIGTVTYYAESVNSTTNCPSLTRTAVTLTINALPLAPTSGGDLTECEATPIQTLTAAATSPIGSTVVWYNAATGGSIVASPTLNSIGTITYYAESVNSTTNCASSTRTPIVLTINAASIQPISGGDITECEATPLQTLTAAATSPVGSTAVWYDAATGGSIVASPILNSIGTVTYYAESVNSTTNCPSLTRTAVTLTINALPLAPTSGGDLTECEATPIQTLTAAATSPIGSTVVWYNAATGGSIVASPTLNSIGTITYYAESVNSTTNCASSTRTPIVLTINAASIQPISGGDITECEATPLQTLTAAATSPVGSTAVWYDATTGGSIVASPILNSIGTVTYYAESVNSTTNCPSLTRTAVTLTINALPLAPTSGGDLTECEATPIQTLTAAATSPIGSTVVWYNAATGGSIVASPTLNSIGTITYYAESVNSTTNCASSTRTPIVLTINAASIQPISGGDITECEATPLQTLTAAATSPVGSTAVWYDAATGGSIVASPILNSIGTVTYYAESVNSTTNCPSLTRTAVTLTINALPLAPTSGGDLTECEATPIQTLTAAATSPIGSTVVWYNAATGGSIVASPTLNSIGTITYYAESVNSTTNCASSTRTPIVLTISKAPNAGTLNGTQEICTALKTIFTTDSPEVGVWSSSDVSIATVDSTTGEITGVTAGTTDILYTVVGTGGCQNAVATRTVTVTAAPVVGTLSGIQNICVGLTTTFSSTTIGGTWSSSDVSVATIDSSTGLVTGVGAGTASMVYTVEGNGGCSNVSDALAITVNANDTPLFTSVPPVCYGATISVLPTTSDNGITGTWSPTLNNTKTTTYKFTPTLGLCAVPTTLEIVVLSLPIITATPSLKEICSNTSPNIELKSDISGTTFDWTVVQTNITGATNSSGDSINQTLSAVSNDKGEALYTITPTANGCQGASITAKIIVNPIPTVSTTGNEPICSGNTTNISLTGTVIGTTFSWNAVSNKVLGAFSSTGSKIVQTLKTATNVQGSVDYSIVPLSNGCIGSPTLITVVVNPVPEVFGSSKTTICSGDSTNIILSPSIVGTQFDWTVSQDGVTGASLGTGDLIQQTLVAGKTLGSATYTITPTVGGCSGTSIKIKINVNPSPMPEIEDGIICVTSDTGETLKSYLLDTQLSNSTYDFKWYFDDEEIVGASQNKYEATDTGVYSVIATNTITSCVSDEKKVTVVPNYPADSFTVAVSDAFTQNATITVTVQGGTGPYFYQLDNGLEQVSTVFTNVNGGEHTITVTDEQGCTSESQKITIIDYPKYFTPNGDGYNDRWNIGGLTNTNIDIYDRYGKLIKQINTSSLGWDGTFNGQLLPATDYWFTVEYIEPNTNATKIFKSHFSLKR